MAAARAALDGGAGAAADGAAAHALAAALLGEADAGEPLDEADEEAAAAAEMAQQEAWERDYGRDERTWETLQARRRDGAISPSRATMLSLDKEQSALCTKNKR